MKICMVGLHNLSVLAPEFKDRTVGGEPVQQTLLARALARRGHDVSMVVADLGQADGTRYGGIRTFKAYRPDAGVPVLRFVYPRWTGLWSALMRADADLYYTSCAGMEVGLLALFCRHFGKRFVFRCASDSDCDKSRLLVQHARDRCALRAWPAAGRCDPGAKRVPGADAAAQLRTGEPSRRHAGRAAVVGTTHDLDVLWVGNIRRVKRPDRVLWLAARLPHVAIHMVGGALPGEEALLCSACATRAAAYANLTFHGRLSYLDANEPVRPGEAAAQYLRRGRLPELLPASLDPGRARGHADRSGSRHRARGAGRRRALAGRAGRRHRLAAGLAARPGRRPATAAGASWRANSATTGSCRPTSTPSPGSWTRAGAASSPCPPAKYPHV